MNKNLIFAKLIAFFGIIAILCFGLSYFLSMDIMYYVAQGSIIAAVISLIAFLFKFLFMEHIDSNIKENSQTQNTENNESSVDWMCENCGNHNSLQSKFCNNCGKPHNNA